MARFRLPLVGDLAVFRAHPHPRPPLVGSSAARLAPGRSLVRFPATQVCSSSLYTTMSPSTATGADARGGGNTAFHQAAMAGSTVGHLEKLAQSGIDVNRPNAAGRLPLHTLCSVGYYDVELPVYLVDQARWLIQRTKNVDAPDVDGIRPLHLAAMMSEYLVKELLAAGADPSGITAEGLTPLHLASRARQSNIVGMLIAVLTKSDNTVVIDARDQDGRSPLHHACRSGRYETVSLLLAAGVDPTVQDKHGLTPLDACTEFEEEQALWSDYRKPDLFESQDLMKTAISGDWNADAVGGVKMGDSLRPWVAPGRTLRDYMRRTFGGPFPAEIHCIGSPQHTTCLQDILNILTDALLKHGESMQTLKDQIAACIRRCESENLGLTSACFRYLQSDLDPNNPRPTPSNDCVVECLRHCEDELREAYGRGLEQRQGYIGLAMVENLLRRREYRVLERVFRQDGPFGPVDGSDVGNIARLLARCGFAHLLETLINSKYGREVAADISGPSTSADPILVVAARRELPNMDVIRLLVEKGRVDVNAKSRTGEEAFADIDRPGMVFEDDAVQPGLNTALHEFSKGFHWWHVEQGIPYLLSLGADVEQRNEAGQTPLELADNMPKETFTEEASKALKR